jgi:hypothetical protein
MSLHGYAENILQNEQGMTLGFLTGFYESLKNTHSLTLKEKKGFNPFSNTKYKTSLIYKLDE